jgi:hypothetical protein
VCGRCKCVGVWGSEDMESAEGGLYGSSPHTIVWKQRCVEVIFVRRGSLCGGLCTTRNKLSVVMYETWLVWDGKSCTKCRGNDYEKGNLRTR